MYLHRVGVGGEEGRTECVRKIYEIGVPGDKRLRHKCSKEPRESGVTVKRRLAHDVPLKND